MLRKTNWVSMTILTGMMLLLAVGLADAQKAAPTPTPARPQNQSIVNTTKSNVKDRTVAQSGTEKGWDGKVQGRKVITELNIQFDSAADVDNFAAGKLPVNLVLKNPASGQTITLASRAVSEGFKPVADKNDLAIYVVIDNLTAPIWNDKGCVDATLGGESAKGGGFNITLTYAACTAASENRILKPSVLTTEVARGIRKNIAVLLSDRGVFTEDAAENFKLKINPSSNGVTCCNIIIVSSGKGTGSPKSQGF